MTILIFGATGQLGQDLQRVWKQPDSVISAGHEDCDITDPSAVERFISSKKPDLVVNAAGATDVPGCETKERDAFLINALAVKFIAQSCRAHNARLIQISTDYVFDGTKKEPYSETDTTGPVNTYGISKLMGEHFAMAYHPGAVVVRSSGLYGVFPNRGKKTNFVETMLKLGREQSVVRVVKDEVLTPTYTRNLARQIAAIAENGLTGVVHATNQGSCSWYEFAQAIFKKAGITTKLEPITVNEFKSTVRRPSYSVLENARLKKAGCDRMKPWREALADYFEDKKI